MEFTVEFYETSEGKCPVREFLDILKATDPGDFAAVVSGLARLRNRQNHRAHYPRRSEAGFWNSDTSVY